MLIYGRDIREQMKADIRHFSADKTLTMAIVIIGDDQPSHTYVKGIVKFAEETGV